jgi:predicted HicB family RNase H-like nuclease
MSTVAEDAVRRYLSLPYRIAVTRDGTDDERPWRAVVEELPGCEVHGATPADATARIPSALADWVADAQADGREVPEPRDARSYSGKLLLRMSKTLHSELALAAERDEISLNAYINYVLTTTMQHRHTQMVAGGRSADAPAEDQRPDRDTARLQRFLALALAANVAVAAAIAIVAVILLLAAS